MELKIDHHHNKIRVFILFSSVFSHACGCITHILLCRWFIWLLMLSGNRWIIPLIHTEWMFLFCSWLSRMSTCGVISGHDARRKAGVPPHEAPSLSDSWRITVTSGGPDGLETPDEVLRVLSRGVNSTTVDVPPWRKVGRLIKLGSPKWPGEEHSESVHSEAEGAAESVHVAIVFMFSDLLSLMLHVLRQYQSKLYPSHCLNK